MLFKKQKLKVSINKTSFLLDMSRSENLKMKNEQSTEKIKYSKDNESVEMNLFKVDRGQITNIIELETGIINDIIAKDETTKLSIAPNRIKDTEIKKPEEKEPSLLQMIKYKLKGDEQNSKNRKNSNDDKLDKL